MFEFLHELGVWLQQQPRVQQLQEMGPGVSVFDHDHLRVKVAYDPDVADHPLVVVRVIEWLPKEVGDVPVRPVPS